MNFLKKIVEIWNTKPDSELIESAIEKNIKLLSVYKNKLKDCNDSPSESAILKAQIEVQEKTVRSLQDKREG